MAKLFKGMGSGFTGDMKAQQRLLSQRQAYCCRVISDIHRVASPSTQASKGTKLFALDAEELGRKQHYAAPRDTPLVIGVRVIRNADQCTYERSADRFQSDWGPSHRPFISGADGKFRHVVFTLLATDDYWDN